ncbi:MAG: hypothetical protein WD055_00115 [Candidatus Dependentiae bacterium]
MKKNTLALILALTAVGAAQAGPLDWVKKQVGKAQAVGTKALDTGKKYAGQAQAVGQKAVDTGKAAYTQYGDKVQQGLTKGQELYGQHGEKIGGVVGPEKAGMVGQGLGTAQAGWTKAGGYLGKRANVTPAG